MKQVGVATQDDLDTVRKRVRELERARGHDRVRTRPGSTQDHHAEVRRAEVDREEADGREALRRQAGGRIRRLSAGRTAGCPAAGSTRSSCVGGWRPAERRRVRPSPPGMVRIAGITATKPATLVAEDAPVVLAGPVRPVRLARRREAARRPSTASASTRRGGRCLDAGASTGGFTDCLLRRGAARVIAVDVGYGQLAWELRIRPARRRDGAHERPRR